jgi:plasmid maintenance system antidote protein VapI
MRKTKKTKVGNKQQAAKAAKEAGVSLAKLKKLIAAKDSQGFAMAVEMVRTLGLDNEATWLSLLTKTRVRDMTRFWFHGQAKPRQDQNLQLLLEIAGLGTEIGAFLVNSITLDGLKELTAGSARTLAIHREHLNLSNVNHITDDVARALGQHVGLLDLSGLSSLSDVAAQALAKNKGALYLNGLTSLTDSAARALANQQGTLRLNDVTSLSDAAIEALAKHQGNLELSSLTILSNRMAAALANLHGELSLLDLESLGDSPGHIALAQKLARQKGDLQLGNLRSLSDTAAHELAQRKRWLYLSGAAEKAVQRARKRLAEKKG